MIVYDATAPAETYVMGPGMAFAEVKAGDRVRYNGSAMPSVRAGASGAIFDSKPVHLSGGFEVLRVLADGGIVLCPSARMACIVQGGPMVPAAGWVLPEGAEVTVLNA